VFREVPTEVLAFQEEEAQVWEICPTFWPLLTAKFPRDDRFVRVSDWAQTFRHPHEKFGLFPSTFAPQRLEIHTSAWKQ